MADKLWTLEGFDQQMADWIMRENPDEDRRAAVAEWIPSRRLNPTAGVRDEPAVEGLRWLKVPHTSDGETAILCAFFIDHARGVVKCTQIGSVPNDA